MLTPRARTVAKRWAFWAAAALVSLGIAFGALATAGTVAAGGYLDPTNPAPGGALAVAEVLRQQGVDVVVTSSLDETRAVLTSPTLQACTHTAPAMLSGTAGENRSRRMPWRRLRASQTRPSGAAQARTAL